MYVGLSGAGSKAENFLGGGGGDVAVPESTTSFELGSSLVFGGASLRSLERAGGLCKDVD